MSEFKGTAGHWVSIKAATCWTVESSDGQRLADLIDSECVFEEGHEFDHSKENAFLMATAPELFAALQTLVARIDYYASLPDRGEVNIEDWAYTAGSDDMNAARAAIAKALGQ